MSDVIIGIGGTGGKVVRALRDRIRQTRGRTADGNHYLCLDTMSYGYYLKEVYGETDSRQLFAQGAPNLSDADVRQLMDEYGGGEGLAVDVEEYLQLRGLPMQTLAELIDDPDAKGGTYSWLHARNLINVLGVSDEVFQFKAGAGQFRQIGRIGAMTTASAITQRMRRIEERSRPNEEESQRNIYLVCSLAGGTGSGNFVDVGVLARNVFSRGRHQQGGGESADKVTLLLLMDGAFGGEDEVAGRAEDMRAITWSVMRELSRFQSPPLPKQESLFLYPQLPPVPLKNQTVFDQVCLMDFEGRSVSEGFRRSTVYPVMAEMLDLLTAPGTGPAVALGMINVNKDIRYMQARSQESERLGTAAMREAWAQRKFSPYFSTFSSTRFLFARRAYARRAAARSIQQFVDQLIGRGRLDVNATHFHMAMDRLTANTATADLVNTLFGNMENLNIDLSTGIDAETGRGPVHEYFERAGELAEGQRQMFMHAPAKDMLHSVDANLVAYVTEYAPIKVLPDSLQCKDPKLRGNLISAVDGERLNQFGLKTRADLASKDLSLDLKGRAQNYLSEALANQMRAVRQQMRGWIQGRLDQPRRLREVLLVLQVLREHPLRAIIDSLRERSEKIAEHLKESVNRANQRYTDLAGLSSGGRGHGEISMEYIRAERDVFQVIVRTLANMAQERVILEMDKCARSWIEAIEGTLREMVATRPDSVHGMAEATLASTGAKLREWAESESVVLGDPSALTRDDDTEMHGFVDSVLANVDSDVLSIDDLVEWKMHDRSEGIGLSLDESAPMNSAKDIHQWLNQRALSRYGEVFEEWTYLRYLWENVCQQDEARLESVVKQLVGRLADLRPGIGGITEGQVHTRRYLICNKLDQEINGAGLRFRAAVEKSCSTLGVDVNFVEDVSARDEVSFVRMDSGLDERNVQKLRDALDTYETYIDTRSSILPLAHVFPEEQGMVALEIASRDRNRAAQALLVPSVLGPMFADERMAQLFIALYLTGLIFVPEDARDGIPNQYLLHANLPALTGSMRDPSALRDFVEGVQGGDLKSHLGYLWALTPNYERPKQSEDAVNRRASDHYDLYTAMARFVQRQPNAFENFGVRDGFPIDQEEAKTLWERFKELWRLQRKGNELFQARLLRFAGKLEEFHQALDRISDDAWEQPETGESALDLLQQEAGIMIHGAPLTKDEAKAFIRVLKFMTERYASLVEPPPKPKRMSLFDD